MVYNIKLEEICINNIVDILGGNINAIREFVILKINDRPDIDLDEVISQAVSLKEEKDDVFVSR